MACQLIELASIFMVKSTSSQTLRFLYGFTIPAFFCYLKLLHTIFYNDMLNSFILVLNEQIEHLSKLVKFNETRLNQKHYSKFLMKRLKCCKNFYKIIKNINELQNSVGAFFVINHVNFNIRILSSLYWTTFRLLNQTFISLICKLIKLYF